MDKVVTIVSSVFRHIVKLSQKEEGNYTTQKHQIYKYVDNWE